MKRSASSLWERIRQKASASLGNGLIPDQYRQMFLRKNYLLNASRIIIADSIIFICVLAMAAGLLGGWFELGEERRALICVLSAVFAPASAVLLCLYFIWKKRIIRSIKIVKCMNTFSIFMCIAVVICAAVIAYPGPDSLLFYAVGLFAFALFFYTTIWQSMVFYAGAHAAFVALMLVSAEPDGNVAQSILFTTGGALLAWVGSRMLYRARAGGFMSDVAQAELQHMSLTDPLLGISNRRRFDIAMQFSWNYCRREQKPISLAMIDIDYFKRYNDRFGHSRGDECLKQVTAAIGAMIHRESDELARVGGEELAFMLPLTPLEDAARIMEKARMAVAELKIENPDAPGGILTVSAGVAGTVPGAGRRITSPQELYQAADDALYNAKKQGRNRICLG